MDALYAHLHRSLAEPFVWGQSDCMMDIVNYLRGLTGYDCAARFRGAYDSAASCHRLTGFLTDPVAPLAGCLAEFPLEETPEPQRGDVGIVRVVDGRERRAVGGIFLGRNWAVKGDTGLAIGPVIEILRAWHVPADLKAPACAG